MAPVTDEQEIAPPPRFLLRPAGVLTQLVCAFALLLGTISVILVQQNKTGGMALVIAWGAAAMAGVVFGGLMSRGGLLSVIASALIVGAFGTVLLVIDWDTLRSLLRLLPESDVAMIADILVGVAIGMIAISVLSLASIPQARAYHRALREAEDAAEKSGFFQAQPSGEMPRQVQVPITLPGRPALREPAPPAYGAEPATLPRARTTSPVAVPPPPPTLAPGLAFRAGAGSSVAHTSAVAAYSPAVPPAYRDSAPAYGAPLSPDGPPLMPPPAHAYAPPDGPPLMPAPRVSDRLPLPAPPPTGDGYAPPPQDPPTTEIPQTASTNPGWAPSPARTFTTTMIVRPPQVEKRSRRRVYMALGGFAIGLGAGVGILVSSMQSDSRDEIAAKTTPSSASSSSPVASGAVATTRPGVATPTTEPALDAGAPAASDASTVDAPVVLPPIHNFLDGQRALIGVGDLAKLVQTFQPTAFAFGVDAEDVAEGRDAIEAMFTKNLGDPPPDGYKVVSKFLAIGQEGAAAWTAEEIELSGPDLAPRRLVISQALSVVDGAWTVVAACWARTVRDETAERLAILGTLPAPRAVIDRIDDAALGAAAKAAFASRKAFADARSERDDAFNFGSGPGERIVGGAKIRALFTRLRSELRRDGGMRVMRAGTVGVAALNVVYTAKGRAATDVSQTFRVLAVFLEEGTAWKIVQTQFSNAGPIND